MRDNIISDFLCTLCGSKTYFFNKINEIVYYACDHCGAVLIEPLCLLSPDNERERYLKHNNDVNDIRYQKFVMPLVDEIKRNYSVKHYGLDFGAGTGPVITRLLRDSGYKIELYDPFFWNNVKSLKCKYDYIICCEAIEHFRNPGNEFKLLRSLMNKNGMLLCKTSLYNETLDFESWYYKNDPTHVVFYTEKTLGLIKAKYNFTSLAITENFIKFSV